MKPTVSYSGYTIEHGVKSLQNSALKGLCVSLWLWRNLAYQANKRRYRQWGFDLELRTGGERFGRTDNPQVVGSQLARIPKL